MKLHEIYSLGGQTLEVADFIEDNIASLALTTPEDYPEIASKIAARLLKANFQWSWIKDSMGYPRGSFHDGENIINWSYHGNPPQYRVIMRPYAGNGGAYTLGYFRDHDIIDTLNKHNDAAPIREGLGSDVLAFTEYLDSRMRKEVADTRKYQRVANLLFKNGYEWVQVMPDEPDEEPHFKKGENRISMTGHKYSRGITFWTEDGRVHKHWALKSVDKFGMKEIDRIFSGELPYATR
jgi:hypothetical protein